jgi:hypothetical protein
MMQEHGLVGLVCKVPSLKTHRAEQEQCQAILELVEKEVLSVPLRSFTQTDALTKSTVRLE